MSKTSTASVLFLSLISFLLFSCSSNPEDTSVPVEQVAYEEPVIEFDSYNLPITGYEIQERRVRSGESLSTILTPFGFSGLAVNNVVSASRDVFNIRSIAAGRTLRFYTNDATGQLDYMVYIPRNTRFVVFDFTNEEPVVFNSEREQERVLRYVEGEISGSLYMSLMREGGSPALASALSNVFAWQVDFYRILRGDSFSVLYEDILIDGESVGTGRIKAANLTHRGTSYDAFYFDQNGEPDYFDNDGNSLRRAFLRAPLEYTRISSRFTNRRVHPVHGRAVAHHGTDYAAPTGTPIRAVGDGTIVHRGFDNANGNYIRIRHNSVYDTGYLHMSRFAPGLSVGSRVTQGQIIGYVGATGLATGPHLCFRFWQNGTPVDPYRVEMPPSNPVADEYRAAFELQRMQWISLMNETALEQEISPILVMANPYQNGVTPLVLIQ